MFSIFLDLKNRENSIMIYGGLPDQFQDKDIKYLKNYEKKVVHQGSYKSDYWKVPV